MKVALDAMGGDQAPQIPVEGALEAAEDLGIHVILVGDEARIAPLLDGRAPSGRVDIHHCEEAVGMEESPLKAVRYKKKASIRVAFQLVKQGVADAVVSAGNSGATLAAGVLTLGRLPGVERPAIAGLFPARRGTVVLIDVGANVDCRPSQLVQFGIMANAFATSCLGMQAPRIGLLSIGEEAGKGNEQVRLTHELFKRPGLNFAGNVEGRDIFTGDIQIVVCDGFVGNVALKVTEGMAELMVGLFQESLQGSFLGRLGMLLSRRPLKGMMGRLNYEEYGGAPLLGINGVGIVCHGKSSARAIRNALALAAQYAENRVLDKMARHLNTLAEIPRQNGAAA